MNGIKPALTRNLEFHLQKEKEEGRKNRRTQIIVAIIGVVLNLVGIDDIGLFIGFNPLLNFFSSTKPCRDTINSVPYLWYILSVISMAGFGLIIDAISINYWRLCIKEIKVIKSK